MDMEKDESGNLRVYVVLAHRLTPEGEPDGSPIGAFASRKAAEDFLEKESHLIATTKAKRFSVSCTVLLN